ERQRRLGIGTGERMVVPRVTLHVDRDRHVAAGALRARAASRMVGVALLLVRLRVTRAAQLVAWLARTVAVRVVTVPAAHALGVHAARLERGQLVELLVHLAVRMVGVGIEELGLEGVQERLLSGREVCAVDAAAVAASAGGEQQLGIATRPGVLAT